MPHKRLQGPVQGQDLRVIKLAKVVEMVKLFALMILFNDKQKC